MGSGSSLRWGVCCVLGGGEAEAGDFELGSVGVMKVGVGNAGALLEPPLCLVQLLYEFTSWALGRSKDERRLSGLRSLFKLRGGLGGSEPVLRPMLAGSEPLRPVALSPTGRSCRFWKFLGLRPRTTIAADFASAIGILWPDNIVATSCM